MIINYVDKHFNLLHFCFQNIYKFKNNVYNFYNYLQLSIRFKVMRRLFYKALHK